MIESFHEIADRQIQKRAIARLPKVTKDQLQRDLATLEAHQRGEHEAFCRISERCEKGELPEPVVRYVMAFFRAQYEKVKELLGGMTDEQFAAMVTETKKKMGV